MFSLKAGYIWIAPSMKEAERVAKAINKILPRDEQTKKA